MRSLGVRPNLSDVFEMLQSKIHRGRITAAHVDYEGSFGIDKAWMETLGIRNFQAVEIYNVTNGNRLKTYAIPLPAGSKRLESNGAAAHLIRPDDIVIIACYQHLSEQQLDKFTGPMIALMNPQDNSVERVYQPDWKTADGSKDLTEFDLL